MSPEPSFNRNEGKRPEPKAHERSAPERERTPEELNQFQTQELQAFCDYLADLGCVPLKLELLNPYALQLLYNFTLEWVDAGGLMDGPEIIERLDRSIGWHKREGLKYPSILLKIRSQLKRARPAVEARELREQEA
jgi:hypothetical protein